MEPLTRTASPRIRLAEKKKVSLQHFLQGTGLDSTVNGKKSKLERLDSCDRISRWI